MRWLKYYENSGEQLDHYVKVVKDQPYNYSTHFLPHDGAHGNIRGLNVSTQLVQMGLKNQVLPRESDINPGIDLMRQTIGFSCFDQKGCADGLHALENYAYEWDEDRGIFKSKPMHNWASHGASAARYAALAASQIKTILTPPQKSTYRPKRSGWMG
ncbi:MAG: hypothetical protein E6R03_11860 [Hyphomicrobiaceae bacterium]|nr:MAG: hypothetical protein E6R03_11860 [Hyphomicrobiaceae bacterium]